MFFVGFLLFFPPSFNATAENESKKKLFKNVSLKCTVGLDVGKKKKPNKPCIFISQVKVNDEKWLVY